MDRLLQDIRYAVRSLSKRPGFAITTIAIVALGVGATTAIFSVVDAVLLKPLPYPEAERLVTLWKDQSSVPVPDFNDWRQRTESYEAWGAAYSSSVDLTGEGEPERIVGVFATAEMFSVLGARAALGRTLMLDDQREGTPDVAVLSYDLWQRRFGGDPEVIGKTVTLNGEPVVVVGALMPDFAPPEVLFMEGADILLPLELTRADLQSRTDYILSVVARLRPGVTLVAAQAEADVLAAALAEEYPSSNRDGDGNPLSIDVITLKDATLGEIGGPLYMLLGAVGLLLLIACANVANLFLARGTDREREMALRSALGAARGRIVAQLLTESVLVGVVGGAIGVAIAFLGVGAFNILNPGEIPRLEEVGVDLRVLGFAAALAILTGIAFGIVPALSSALVDSQAALRQGALQATAGRRALKLRSALVVAEVGLALVLLVGAGLLFNSFVRLRQVETGFESEGRLTLNLDIGLEIGAVYEDEERVQFAEELLERLAAEPHVRAIGASWRLPFAGGRCCWRSSVWPVGTADTVRAWLHPVTPGYFSALGIPIREGRFFTRRDGAGKAIAPDSDPEAERVPDPAIPVIVNRSVAQRLWRGGRAVGQMMDIAYRPTTQFEVVGVIDDIRHYRLDREADLAVYMPFTVVAAWIGMLDVVVRYEGPISAAADALRRTVWELDPNLPLGEMISMEGRIARSINTPRFYALLVAMFATIAFLLSAGGIYGSMLYTVGQRKREMGIRIALGAESGAVLRMVLGRGMMLTAVGLGLGLAGAFAFSRTLETLVFGITPTDPATFASVSVLLAAVALVACYLPARLAARTDPMTTLRTE